MTLAIMVWYNMVATGGVRGMLVVAEHTLVRHNPQQHHRPACMAGVSIGR